MSEPEDPAIKLFGKTIPLPEISGKLTATTTASNSTCGGGGLDGDSQDQGCPPCADSSSPDESCTKGDVVERESDEKFLLVTGKTMDQTVVEGVGIKIYSPTPQEDPTTYTRNPSQRAPSELGPEHGGRKRRAVAKGVQKTISKTSMLINFLPTGTLLTFEMILPSVYRTGECTRVDTLMILLLLGLCALSCFFFHFTDSFRGPDGKVYYGFVTHKGLAVFKPGLDVEIPKDDRYKVGFTDFVHAVMSVMVFVAIAFSDHRVTNCLFPRHVKEMDQVMESFPLMVGVACSGLFLVFPNTRYGIGCMAS